MVGSVLGMCGGGTTNSRKFCIFLQNTLILGIFDEKLMLLKCGIEISIAKTSSNWLRKLAMAMWEVANGKI